LLPSSLLSPASLECRLERFFCSIPGEAGFAPEDRLRSTIGEPVLAPEERRFSMPGDAGEGAFAGGVLSLTLTLFAGASGGGPDSVTMLPRFAGASAGGVSTKDRLGGESLPDPESESEEELLLEEPDRPVMAVFLVAVLVTVADLSRPSAGP